MADNGDFNRKQPIAPKHSLAGFRRREFLASSASAFGGLLLGKIATPNDAAAQQPPIAAPGMSSVKFTDWGWPQPYEQISTKSKQWLQSKGWWPLGAAWIVVWSGEEMIGNILQDEKLLEKRGLEVKWQTFVAAGFSNEAFIPGRIQLASTGAL